MNINLVAKLSNSAAIEAALFAKKALNPLSQNLLTVAADQVQSALGDTSGQKYADGDFILVNQNSILLLDLLADKHLSPAEQLRFAGYRLAKKAHDKNLKQMVLNLSSATVADFASLASGVFYANYKFTKYKSQPSPAVESELFIVAPEAESSTWSKALNDVRILSENIDLARNLVNEPGSSLRPADLVEQARQVAQAQNLTITVRQAEQLEAEGFNGLLTVGKGSPHTPALVTLQYRPHNAVPQVHLGIVGKGLTFDTGGISIKPATDMWEMKMDMAGAAATLGAISAIAQLQIPVNVTAVLCIAENRPGLSAVLPGDIFTAKNGKTIMVDNTDAEGRLVLTDGLWESGQYGVTHLVDLATLTGAIIRALGDNIAGLFSNSSEFSAQIMSSEATTGEKFWPMPLPPEYAESLKDKVADFKNIGGIAGSITAALFLQEFIPAGVNWSHWDIAGTAFNTKTWKYYDHGGTGFGVQTLVQIATAMAHSPADFSYLPPNQDENDD